MKDARVHKLRQWAECDLRISHCARTLLFRIFSDRYTDPHHRADEPFELPWTQVAHWCGLADKMHCYEITNQLRLYGYLWDNGVRGCPPTRVFRLNLALNLAKELKQGIIPTSTPRKSPLPARVKKKFAALKASLK